MPMWSLDAFVLRHGAHSRIRVVWNVAVEWPDAWVVGIKCDLDNRVWWDLNRVALRS